MEELLKKAGLEEKIIYKIIKDMKENKIFLTNEENIEDRYNKLKAQKEDIEEKLTKAKYTIDDMKRENISSKELKKVIKEHENTIKKLDKDSKTKIRSLTIDNAINNLLKDNKAKYTDLLSSKFQRDSLNINEDGTISGLEEQFRNIKDSYKDLFQQPLCGNVPYNKECNTFINNSYENLLNNVDNMTAEEIADQFINLK